MFLALNFPCTLASNESRSLIRLPDPSRGLAFLTTKADPGLLPAKDESAAEVVTSERVRFVDVEDDVVVVVGRLTIVRIVKGIRLLSPPLATFFFTIFMNSVVSLSFYNQKS